MSLLKEKLELKQFVDDYNLRIMDILERRGTFSYEEASQ